MNDTIQAIKPRKEFKAAMLSEGVVKSITYAANNPHIFDGDMDSYHDVMDVFQDHIPYELIDCNQWWFSHYLSSGRKCNKCLEIAHLFPCDEQVSDRHFESMTQNMILGHDPSCSAHNVHSFVGLKVCMARFSLMTKKPIQHTILSAIHGLAKAGLSKIVGKGKYRLPFNGEKD